MKSGPDPDRLSCLEAVLKNRANPFKNEASIVVCNSEDQMEVGEQGDYLCNSNGTQNF